MEQSWALMGKKRELPLPFSTTTGSGFHHLQCPGYSLAISQLFLCLTPPTLASSSWSSSETCPHSLHPVFRFPHSLSPRRLRAQPGFVTSLTNSPAPQGYSLFPLLFKASPPRR